MNRGFNFWPLTKLDPPFCKLLFGGSNVATKLFDTVTQLDAAGTYAPSAAEDVQVDLQAAAGNVTIDFPAAGTEGQCIGVTLKAVAPITDNWSIGYTGAVDVLVPSTLVSSGDCDLFTWDADLSVWALVASFRQGRPFNDARAVSCNGDTTGLEVSPGDVLRIVFDSDVAADVPITLPTVACEGHCIIARMVANNVPGNAYAATIGGVNLQFAGDTVVLTWDGSGWVTALQQSGSTPNARALAFVDADLSGGALAWAHLLQCQAPLLAIYDDTGAAVPQSFTSPPAAGTWSVQINSTVQLTVTFDAALLPLSGTWRIQAAGAPI